jgi:hypothetical protein
MLGLVVLLIIIGGALIALLPTLRGTRSTLPHKQERTMLLAHDSTDIVSESYLPAIKDMSMPFPVGKKKERKKTETFRRHSDD